MAGKVSHHDLTLGPIFPHILRMALPMMIGMTAHMVVNIIDGVYAGRLGMNESMAVLNYGFPFFYLFFAILNGIGSGLSSYLARAIGAKQLEQAENTLTLSLWSSLGAFAIFLAAYPLVLPIYLNAQGASSEAAILTRQYLNALFIGMPFTILATLLGSALRAQGDTRTLMNAMMAGTLVNVLFAPFVIYSEFTLWGMHLKGLGLSVTGAGIATTGSAFFTCAVILWHQWKARPLLKLRLKPIWAQREGFFDTLRVAFPSMLSQALIGFNLAALTYLAQPFGPHTVAAIGISARLDIISIFPALAIMIAVISLVGQNYGAGNSVRVRETIRKGLQSAFVSLTVIGLLVFVFRQPLIHLFRPEPATFPSAMDYLRNLSLTYGFVGLAIVAAGAFQGLGQGLPYFFLTLLRLVLLSLPLAFILGKAFGESGFHLGVPLSSVIAGLIAVFWLHASLKHKAAATVAPKTEMPVTVKT